MHFMPEVRKVGFFMRGGDIVTINADGEDVKVREDQSCFTW